MRRLLLVGVVLVAAAVLPGAAAATNYAWTGASGTPNWSAANWTQGTPSNGEAIGALGFSIAGAPLALNTTNDLTGLTANSLSVWEGGYTITGNALGLGAGGLTAIPYSPGNRTTTSSVTLPITLLADQTWSVPGDAAPVDNYVTSALQVSSVSGSHSLTVSLGSDAPFGVQTAETGALVLNGTDASQAGQNASKNAVVTADELNTTTGGPVTVKNVELDTTGASPSTGPLTAAGADIVVGAKAPAVLSVHGDLSLDSATQLSLGGPNGMTIDSFSKVQVSGNASLGGSLRLDGPPADSCNADTGDTLPLLTAGGALSGTFSNAPEGTILPIECGPPWSPVAAVIHYSGHAVTAQIVPSWTLNVHGDPAQAVTNRPVNLVAWVSISTPSPSGPAGTIVLPCGPHPVQVTSPTTGYVSCQMTVNPVQFAVPEGLHAFGLGLAARFTPAGSSGEYVSGGDSAFKLVPAPTSTSLAASRTVVPVGGGLTLTAAYTSPFDSPLKPNGGVTLTDNAVPIPACRALFDSVTCTIAPSPGLHIYRAGYLTDEFFAASTSPPVTVEVEPGTVSVGHPQLSGSRLALPVRCSGAPCTVEVTLTSGRSTYARDKATIRPERAVYHLRLSSSAARSLARHHRLATTLHVTQLVGRTTHNLSRRTLTFRITRR